MIRHHVRSFGSNKILAIKLVRELTGCGLRHAKDFVESRNGFEVTADAATRIRIRDEARRAGIEFDPMLDGAVPAWASPDRPGPAITGEYSVRYRSGPRKIAAIKLVRELTGLGLKDAKELVENDGLIRTGITQSEANALAAQFLELESQVDVLEPSAQPSPQQPSPQSSPGSYAVQAEDDDDF